MRKKKYFFGTKVYHFIKIFLIFVQFKFNFTLICRYFEYLIMCLIVSNSLLIAAYDYSDRASVTQRNITINQFMFAFQIMFVIECVLKIIAMGFVLNENSYLRNGWNIIDFIVIVLG